MTQPFQLHGGLHITWHDAMGPNEMVFRRVYVERSPMQIAVSAKIYVKLPCDGHTDDRYLMTTAPASPTQKFPAPSQSGGGAYTYGTTDSKRRGVIRISESA